MSFAMGLIERTGLIHVVHILWHGHTFCGLVAGTAEWPKDHFWVGRSSVDVARANCPACLHNERLPF